MFRQGRGKSIFPRVPSDKIIYVDLTKRTCLFVPTSTAFLYMRLDDCIAYLFNSIWSLPTYLRSNVALHWWRKEDFGESLDTSEKKLEKKNRLKAYPVPMPKNTLYRQAPPPPTKRCYCGGSLYIVEIPWHAPNE